MSFYTLTISQDSILYTESDTLMSVIHFLSELKVPCGCPIKTHIAIDAIKQWAIICNEHKIICTKKSIIELFDAYYTQLYKTLSEEVEDYDEKMKFWNDSGINFYRETLKEDDKLYQT